MNKRCILKFIVDENIIGAPKSQILYLSNISSSLSPPSLLTFGIGYLLLFFYYSFLSILPRDSDS